MPKRLEPPPLGPYRIVCPYCESKDSQNLTNTFSDCLCSNCGKSFRVLLTTVRAKRGRATKGMRCGHREYIIRIIISGNVERVLQFEDVGGSNLDLRSRDIMYAGYKIGKGNNKDWEKLFPAILGNVTTNQCVLIEEGVNIWELIREKRERDQSKR
ncbi:hypothetical protein ACFLRN_06405 [Thermoproteota archaeon]